jgi:hypothetical protein
VIFDGLDELFDPAGRELAAERIAGFAARYTAARILVTSRIVGYRRGILSGSDFEHYTLQDLSDEQISGFLATWYSLAFHGRDQDAAERRQRLLKVMSESRSIRELAGNPMLLTILAIIGKGQELPRERWKLYDHAATVLLHHWDVNKHLRDERIDADFIGEDDKKELLRQVAHRMQAGTAGLTGNHLPASQLQDAFESYLRDRYQRDPASAKVIAAAMIGQFHERNFILSRYGAGVYGFVHRAFLEFFCADYYVQQFEKLQELSIGQLTQQVFAAHWADPSWREVLRLIAGRIAGRFAGEIIRFLARDAYQPWPQRFGDRPPRNIALAVQCLGEVHSPGVVRKDAEELLHVIIRLLEHSIGTQDRTRDTLLQDELLPAIRAVGPAWPGRELYQPWYQQQQQRAGHGAGDAGSQQQVGEHGGAGAVRAARAGAGGRGAGRGAGARQQDQADRQHDDAPHGQPARGGGRGRPPVQGRHHRDPGHTRAGHHAAATAVSTASASTAPTIHHGTSVHTTRCSVTACSPRPPPSWARKAQAMLDVGAPLLVSANPGCSMQIAAAVADRGEHVAVAHTAEILDASLRGQPPPA